ncbi:MAG: DbpA RNA binding domain-containing protein [Clostridia bacterium]|nr:DbpA RNA binding domain-containing protein [Spirochaetia bacterium]
MPSYKTIEEGRRKAMEDLIDEIMEELRVPANIPVLHECRTLFRKKVPLTMRAYVAAALAYRFSAPGNSGSGRQARKDHVDKQGGRPDSRPAPQRDSQRIPRKEPQRDSQRETQRETPQESQRETQRETFRENRYQGEGVVLFVGAGRRQRFYARVALRMLVDSGQVMEEQIGDIRTMDNYSFINIDPTAEDTAIRVLGGTEYKGRLLTVNRAKKKEDPATQD